MSKFGNLARNASYVVPGVGLGVKGYHDYTTGRQRGKEKQARESDRRKRNFGLLQDSIDQGGSFDQIMARLRKGYEGDPNELPQFLEQNKAFLASGLLNTDAAKDMTDTGRFMGLTYGPGAGQIEQGISQATNMGAGGLSMSGMSASGASPALAMNARLQGGAAKGQLYSGLMQQHLQNRWNLNSDVAGMALGFAPPARPSGGGQDYSGYFAGAGALIGAALPLVAGSGGGARQPAAQTQGYKQQPTGGQGGLY